MNNAACLARVCGSTQPQLIINITEILSNANWPETRKPFLAIRCTYNV